MHDYFFFFLQQIITFHCYISKHLAYQKSLWLLLNYNLMNRYYAVKTVSQSWMTKQLFRLADVMIEMVSGHMFQHQSMRIILTITHFVERFVCIFDINRKQGRVKCTGAVTLVCLLLNILNYLPCDIFYLFTYRYGLCWRV